MKFDDNARRGLIGAVAVAMSMGFAATSLGQKEEKPEFPPFKEVADDYEKVVTTMDGSGLYTLYKRDKDGQMLAELPRNFEKQKLFFAMTISAGTPWAGLQGGDRYVYWKRYDKRLALIEPQLETRTTGDLESRASVERHFTDRVLLDVPIVCMGPGGGPVIDFDELLLNEASSFFGTAMRGMNKRLATIAKAKSFPENVEVAFEVPVRDGTLQTFHYSISELRKTPGYKPREADERVGYFTTVYRDLGKFNNDEKWVRYINRWHLEKADPKLKLSPPKQPIIFYVEHTVPVRYRRWVKQGIEYWNKAYEQVGILGAVEVRFQDKATGAHMEKDPEDVRYNFIRWLSNDISTAIGPSRVHPETGEILDADIVLTDGWIRVFWYQFNDLLPDMAMEGFSPDTLAWLDRNPDWDPRIRLSPPAERDRILRERAMARAMGEAGELGGHPAANVDPTLYGDDEFDGLGHTVSQHNGMCMAARGKGYDMALMRTTLQIVGLLNSEGDDNGENGDDENGEEETDEPVVDEDQPEGDLLDGIPDWFVGPQLADLVAHEVGHTLGLRHNFKASSIYTLDEINSEAVKGVKPFTASVMDYNPVNINMNEEAIQGDYAMIDIGPYDFWVIEYGYTFKDPKEVLKKVAEADRPYATDEDTWGPDPLARRYDFSANPLDYAEAKMALAKFIRERLVEKFVEDGESWSKARQGYLITLSEQMSSLSIMANWIGGAYVHRDKKGDPNGRAPIEVVDAETQRRALRFVIENAFHDEAFGLTSEMLKFMTVDKWWDNGGMGTIFEDPTWPVHERILGMQASTLTMLMNPTTLARAFDNEYRVPEGEDALTLPELMFTVSDAAWSEIDGRVDRRYTAREPMISSLRRNLQREHLERMIDLTMPDGMFGAAGKPISNLATFKLREIHDKVAKLLDSSLADRLDPYTLAHLSEARLRIEKALDASYIYNTDAFGMSGMPTILFGADAKQDSQEN